MAEPGVSKTAEDLSKKSEDPEVKEDLSHKSELQKEIANLSISLENVCETDLSLVDQRKLSQFKGQVEDQFKIYQESVDELIDILREEDEKIAILKAFNDIQSHKSDFVQKIEEAIKEVKKGDMQSLKSSHSARESVLARKKIEAEEARANLEFLEKEMELQKQKAAIDAEMQLLAEKKKVYRAEREASIYEESLHCGSIKSDLSKVRIERTRRYVDSLNCGMDEKVTDEEKNTDEEQKEDKEKTTKSKQLTDNQTLISSMFKKDLLLARLYKFNDKPDNYLVWKSTFQSVVTEMNLSPIEELDVMMKWLGSESGREAMVIRSSNATNAQRGLTRIWARLEARYASPETIEACIKSKLEKFPKIGYREHEKLFDLSNIIEEIENLKETESLKTLLAYYDSSSGVNPIVAKLPTGLQEKWTTSAVTYKRKHKVSFPPFTHFAEFMRDLANTKNDPSFIYEKQGRDNEQKTKTTSKYPYDQHKKLSITTKKTELSGREQVPVYCQLHRAASHSLEDCHIFNNKSISARRHFLYIHGICLRCGASDDHLARDCKVKLDCKICHKQHTTTLHEDEQQTSKKDTLLKKPSQNNGEEVVTKCTELGTKQFKGKSCAKIVQVYVYRKGQPEKYLKVYAIIDEQSNRSLAKKAFFDYFQENDKNIEYTLSSCSGKSVVTGRLASDFILESLDRHEQINMSSIIECEDIPDNKHEIPTKEVCKYYDHLQRAKKELPPLDHNCEILLLIGRDIPKAHYVLEQCIGDEKEPFAQRLYLGWVVIGEICHGEIHSDQSTRVNVSKTYILPSQRPSSFPPCNMSYNITEFDVQDIFRRSEDDNKLGLSVEDKVFVGIMESEFTKNKKGNWQAPLPLKAEKRPLPSNIDMATKRAKSLAQNLKRNPEKAKHFFDFMANIIEKGQAEVAPQLNTNEEHWFLPIFGVYHPKKPGKVRVVFDSAAKYRDVCLNDILMTGPDLLNSLIGIILRFRLHKVAILADIEQMFFSFYVDPTHRNFLRFLWFKNNDLNEELIQYRMTVHVFGNAPSPAIATYGIRKAIRSGVEKYGEDTCKYVEDNFYVDDGLLSTPTVEMAISVLKRTQSSLKENGNLRLHKIASNNQEVLKAFSEEDLAKDLQNIELNSTSNLPLQRSLGIYWNIHTDKLTFQVQIQEKAFTRRGMLSIVNGIYDPLGLAAPITIQGKLFMRNWITGSDWDEPLPSEFYPAWENWTKNLYLLNGVNIERWYGLTETTLENCDIHVFADASTEAISAVAYLRMKQPDETYKVSFLMGKAKLTPQQSHTVPRLELCAAVLSVSLAETICSNLHIDLKNVTFYTDSKIVLGYIYNKTRRFYVYVENRVNRIIKSTNPQQWRYVSTQINPADQGTRPMKINSLRDSLWLNGPPFLLNPEDYKATTEDVEVDIMDIEVRPAVTTKKTEVTLNLSLERFKRFSTWKSVVRGVSLLKKFMSKDKDNTNILRETEIFLKKEVQQEYYKEEIECCVKNIAIPKTSSLVKLGPVVDDQGILRVGGRIEKGDFSSDEKHPIIIPGKEYLVKLLVLHYHALVHHQGRSFTQSKIRSSGFWITGMSQLVKSLIHACVMCKRLRGRIQVQQMSQLPIDRLQPNSPFTYIGLDIFGPWKIVTRRTRGGQAQSKRWSVLFTCLVTRAIHLELIEEMSASSFINAFKRFIAIRGPVSLVRSDRGTNFVGATKELGIESINIEDKSMKKFLEDKNITWKFNTPHSSHMGGSWERLIGVARKILEAILLQNKNRDLSHEVLQTYMYEVASMVNSRPLVPIYTDNEDPTVLSPATLLTQKTDTMKIKGIDVPEITLKDSYKSQWKLVQYLSNKFWDKWRSEYIHQLQERRKWQQRTRNIKVGDIVLMKDDEYVRYQWPLGLITETYTDDDNCVRRVQIKIYRGGQNIYYVRPISQMVFLLESDS